MNPQNQCVGFIFQVIFPRDRVRSRYFRHILLFRQGAEACDGGIFCRKPCFRYRILQIPLDQGEDTVLRFCDNAHMVCIAVPVFVQKNKIPGCGRFQGFLRGDVQPSFPE